MRIQIPLVLHSGDRSRRGVAVPRHRLLELQRQAGNRAVTTMLQRDEDERFPGPGQVVGSGTATSPGALAYLARQRELRELPAGGSTVEETESGASLKDWRAAKDRLFEEAGQENLERRRPLPELVGAKAHVEGTASGASLMDWRAAKDEMFAAVGAKNLEAKGQAEPEEDALAATGPVFDEAAATALTGEISPEGLPDVHSWLGTFDEERLLAVGFRWDAGEVILARVAFEKFQADAAATANAELLAQEAEIQERKKDLEATNSATWVLNATAFQNVTEADVAGLAGTAFLAKVAKLGMTANGSKKNKISCHLDLDYHDHLLAGTGGVSFTYIVEEDYTVTPLVYDVADSRDDNQYRWRHGAVGYVSSAKHRKSIDWK